MLSGFAVCGEDRQRRLLPGTFDAVEAGRAQQVFVRHEAAGAFEPVAIEKATAPFQDAANPSIAFADGGQVSEIMDGDGRHREIEGAAHLLGPRRIGEVAERIPQLARGPRKTLPGTSEHDLGIVLQSDPGVGQGAQYLRRDDAVTRTNVQHGNCGVTRKRREGHHALEPRPSFVVARDIVLDPVVDIAFRVPIMRVVMA